MFGNKNSSKNKYLQKKLISTSNKDNILIKNTNNNLISLQKPSIPSNGYHNFPNKITSIISNNNLTDETGITLTYNPPFNINNNIIYPQNLLLYLHPNINEKDIIVNHSKYSNIYAYWDANILNQYYLDIDYGYVFNFDGSNDDKLLINKIEGSSLVNGFTFCAWVYPKSLTKNVRIFQIETSHQTNSLAFEYNDVNTCIIIMRNNTGVTVFTFTISKLLNNYVNNWFHICISVNYDISTSRYNIFFYFNGYLEETFTSNTTTYNFSDYDRYQNYIGTFSTDGSAREKFNGYMTNILMYNCVLDENDVTIIYKNSLNNITKSYINNRLSAIENSYSTIKLNNNLYKDLFIWLKFDEETDLNDNINNYGNSNIKIVDSVHTISRGIKCNSPALHISSLNNFIQTSTIPVSYFTNFTFSCWVYIKSLIITDYRIFDIYNSGSNRFTFLIDRVTNILKLNITKNDNLIFSYSTSNYLELDKWFLMTFTLKQKGSGFIYRLYKNGKIIDNKLSTQSLPTVDNINSFLFNRPNKDAGFISYINDVRFYKCTLQHHDIQNLYNSTLFNYNSKLIQNNNKDLTLSKYSINNSEINNKLLFNTPFHNKLLLHINSSNLSIDDEFITDYSGYAHQPRITNINNIFLEETKTIIDNTSISFNGNDNYLICDGNSKYSYKFSGIDGNTSRTYTTWFNLSNLSNNQSLISFGKPYLNDDIISNGDNTIDNGCFHLYINTDGKLVLKYDYMKFIFENVFIINKWYYITLTFNNNNDLNNTNNFSNSDNLGNIKNNSNSINVSNKYNIVSYYGLKKDDINVSVNKKIESRLIRNNIYKSSYNNLDTDDNLFIHLAMNNIITSSGNKYIKNIGSSIYNGFIPENIPLTGLDPFNKKILNINQSVSNEKLEIEKINGTDIENGFTFSCWIKFTGSSITVSSRIINSSGNDRILFFLDPSNNGIKIEYFKSGNILLLKSTANYMEINKWIFVSITIEQSNTNTIKYLLYKNGKNVDTQSVTGTLFSTDLGLTEICNTNNNRPFIGLIYDIRFYSRILNLEEITTLYKRNTYILNSYSNNTKDTKNVNCLKIGYYTDDFITMNYNGYMNDIRLYNRSLTINELTYIWNNGLGSYNNGSNLKNSVMLEYISNDGILTLNNRILNQISSEYSYDTNFNKIDDKLFLWYPMDTGYGSIVYDRSNNGFNGILSSGAKYENLDFPNKYNISSCCVFDGNDDFIDIPDIASSFFVNGLSFTGWVYFNNSKNWAKIFDFGTGQSSNNIILDRNDNSSGIRFLTYNGNSSASIVFNNYIDNNVWLFISLTSISGNTKIYKNGELFNTSSITYTLQNITRTGNFIGKSNWTGSDRFDGKLSDFRFYSGILSPYEIRKQYLDKVNEGFVNRITKTDTTSLQIMDYPHNIIENSNRISGILTLDNLYNISDTEDKLSYNSWIYSKYSSRGTILSNKCEKRFTNGDFKFGLETIQYDKLFIWINCDNGELNNTNNQYTTINNSGNSNITLTPINGISISSNNTIFRNNVINFDGSDEYIEISNVKGNKFNNGFTCNFWVYFDNSKNWAKLFDFGTGISTNNILLDRNSNTSGIRLQVFNSGSSVIIYFNNFIDDNKWIHLSLTSKSGDTKLYKNGILFDTSTTTYILPDIIRTKNLIGYANRISNEQFDGKMFDIRFYSTILTAEEINDIYNRNEYLTFEYYNYRNNIQNDKLFIFLEEEDNNNIINSGVSDISLSLINGVSIENNIILFDGANDNLELGDISGDYFVNGFTFCGWVKSNTLTAFERIYQFSTNGQQNAIILSYNSVTKKINSIILNSTGSNVYNLESNFNFEDKLNEWIHITLTIKYENNKYYKSLYLNSILDNSGISEETNYDITNLSRDDNHIGFGDIHYFDGEMFDIRYYSTILTDLEIVSIYNININLSFDYKNTNTSIIPLSLNKWFHISFNYSNLDNCIELYQNNKIVFTNNIHYLPSLNTKILILGSQQLDNKYINVYQGLINDINIKPDIIYTEILTSNYNIDNKCILDLKINNNMNNFPLSLELSDSNKLINYYVYDASYYIDYSINNLNTNSDANINIYSHVIKNINISSIDLINNNNFLYETIKFNGSSDYIELEGSLTTNPIYNYNVSFWIYPDGSKTSGNGYIINKWDNDNNIDILEIFYNYSNNELNIKILVLGNQYLTVENKLDVNKWSFVSINYINKEGCYLYINGNLESFNHSIYEINDLIYNSSGNTRYYIQKLNIGMKENNNYFKGYLHNIQVYNGILNDSTILEKYNKIKLNNSSVIINNNYIQNKNSYNNVDNVDNVDNSDNINPRIDLYQSNKILDINPTLIKNINQLDNSLEDNYIINNSFDNQLINVKNKLKCIVSSGINSTSNSIYLDNTLITNNSYLFIENFVSTKDLTSNITISTWFKYTSSLPDYQTIFRYGSIGEIGYGLQLHNDKLEFSDNTSNILFNPEITLNVNEWYNLTYINDKDVSVNKFYLNGVEKLFVNDDFILNNDNFTFVIGCSLLESLDTDNKIMIESNKLTGYIQDFRLYNKVLNDNEIKLLVMNNEIDEEFNVSRRINKYNRYNVEELSINNINLTLMDANNVNFMDNIYMSKYSMDENNVLDCVLPVISRDNLLVHYNSDGKNYISSDNIIIDSNNIHKSKYLYNNSFITDKYHDNITYNGELNNIIIDNELGGKINNTSLFFNGINSNLIVNKGANLNMNSGNEWSISTWIYPKYENNILNTSREKSVIWFKSNNGLFSTGSIMNSLDLTTSNLLVDINTSNELLKIDTNINIPDNKWSLITTTFGNINNLSSNIFTQYVNDIKVYESSISNIVITSPSDLDVIYFSDVGSNVFYGNMDNMMIWNTKLLDGEISRLYNCKLTSYPVNYWIASNNNLSIKSILNIKNILESDVLVNDLGIGNDIKLFASNINIIHNLDLSLNNEINKSVLNDTIFKFSDNNYMMSNINRNQKDNARTIIFRLYIEELPTVNNMVIYDLFNNVLSNKFKIMLNTNNKIEVVIGKNSITSLSNISINKWYSICVVILPKSFYSVLGNGIDKNIRIFINGVYDTNILDYNENIINEKINLLKSTYYIIWEIINNRGDLLTQANEFRLYTDDSKTTFITPINVNDYTNTNPSNQDESKIIDNNTTSTKWLAKFSTVILYFEMSNTQPIPRYYSYFTGGDFSGRDPITWDLRLLNNTTSLNTNSNYNNYLELDKPKTILLDKVVNANITTSRNTETPLFSLNYNNRLFIDNINYSNSIFIGCDINIENNFIGFLDDIRIYNCALSIDEIVNIYNTSRNYKLVKFP